MPLNHLEVAQIGTTATGKTGISDDADLDLVSTIAGEISVLVSTTSPLNVPRATYLDAVFITLDNHGTPPTANFTIEFEKRTGEGVGNDEDWHRGIVLIKNNTSFNALLKVVDQSGNLVLTPGEFRTFWLGALEITEISTRAELGPTSWLKPCQLATTANITLSGEQTIDGTLTATSDVLVKNQSTGAENGPYITASGAWTRREDFNDSEDAVSGIALHVSEGTANADTNWQLTTDDPITLDTTSLTFMSMTSSSTENIIIAVGDETTTITTGTAKRTFRMPYAFTLTDVRSSLTTASSSGLVTVDINEGGVTILSTKLSIDANERTSTTAATAAVISDTSLADDAEITIDIDAAGTSAAGLKVTLIGMQ